LFRWAVLFALIIILVLAVGSCDKSEQESRQGAKPAGELESKSASKRETTKKTKTVRFQDLGFSIELPSDWQRVDEDSIKDAEKQVENKEQISVYEANIEASFYGEHEDFLNISSLSPKEGATGAVALQTQSYVDDLEKHFADGYEVKADKSKTDSFEAIFLQIYNEQFYIVKTVYYNQDGNVFQIDYIIPRNNLTQDLLKQAEDALLSVKKL
jgi:outer membrane lipoprotein-sorting protein